MTNPLLQFDGLPAFDVIRPEHIAPAITRLLADDDAALERAVGAEVPADYEAMSAVLDTAGENLRYVWSVVGHLNGVADTPALRAAYTTALPIVTEHASRHASDERLYAKYKAIAQASAAPGRQLSAARQQALSNAMRDFVLSGAELQGDARAQFQQLQEAQADLQQQFSEHVLDATDSYAYYATAAELVGVPDDALQASRAAAEAEGKPGHKVTLHYPSYFPVMQYADNRALRERLYTANSTRASEAGPPAQDNTAVMHALMVLRQQEAALLGYSTYADVSLVPKMAASPQQVMDFLRDLARRARPHAEKDLAELRLFARDALGITDLQAWDLAYASEKLKASRYAFSDEEVRPYFTEPKVLEGLFHIIEALFEVRIRPDVAPVWHPSVTFYRVERVLPHSDAMAPELVGQFYLDLYARPGKRPGAWMDDVRGRWARPDGRLQTPVAQLVCNFTPPLPGKPALLSHDDVTTLFHEFGHGLHHLLTRVDDLGVSGISGVEWDAVELPSQFMENFCWEWSVVQRLTAHATTGESLPRALFDRMLAAKNFQSGMQTLRQVELALFDMRLHSEVGSEDRVDALLSELRDEVAVFKPPAFNRFQHSFSHIFAGGYSAGYYSYKWAEVLSADAWSAFEETAARHGDVLSVETGRRLRESVFEAGGSRPAMESFKAFRGREPTIDALLRHQGMA
jgi:oligopeptidase A